MKKIYVCQANGTQNKSFVSKNIPDLILLLLIITTIIDFMGITSQDIDKYNFKLMFANLCLIGIIYQTNYVLILPRLQIDSLNNLLIYLGRRMHYSTKLENIHHFFIIEDGIILHTNKKIKIPFSEFKNVDLIGFANSMNKIIKINVDFYTILNEENKIQGFDYFNEDNTKDLRHFMEGGFLTKDIKELQAFEPKFILTKNLWWSHQFPIVSITSMIIIFSIINLSL